MNIGLNLLYLQPNGVGGTETYACQLINALIDCLQPHDRLYLFTSIEGASIFQPRPNLRVVSLTVHSKERIKRIWLENCCLPLLLRRYHITVLHSLGYTCPLWTGIPQVVTIHDLNFHYCPEDFSIIERALIKILVSLSSKTAAHIVTDSKASKRALIEVLHVPKKKVTSIYLGASGNRISSSNASLDHPYILTVSATYPHKNVITLLKAVKQLKNKHIDVYAKICGLSGKDQLRLETYVMENKLDKYVSFLGYIPAKQLESLYRHAAAFVFPSAYEGFGLPVLEAMSRNIPVISSNAFSLREVVGNAGLLFNPQDEKQLAGYIEAVLTNNKLRHDLIKKGRENITKFSWDNTAKETYKIYTMLIGKN